MTPQDAFDHYNNLSKRRALTEYESRSLERAIKDIDRFGAVRAGEWTATEDERLMSMRRSGTSYTEIGVALHRTRAACSKRHRRLESLAISRKRQEKYAAVVDRNEDILAGRVVANEHYTGRLITAASRA